MAQTENFTPPDGGGPMRWALIAGGVLLSLLAAWGLYRFFTDVGGVAMKPAPPPTVVDMLPPPPPPPPPPPTPQEKPPEPVDKPDPAPAPEPQTPDKPAPAPMQINGPAQAGTDSYGMSSGSGNGSGAPGSTGTCIGPNCGQTGGGGVDRFWGRNIANALEQHIQSSRSVNIDSFVGEFDVWVSDGGVLTQARLVRGTGNGRLDQTILGLLQTARGLKPPPPSIRMPQRIRVGRKRL